jgi:hypothetical protein
MRFLTLLLLALATSAAAETKTRFATSPENGDSIYVSSTKRYSVPVPTGWRNVPGEKMGLRENVMFHPTPSKASRAISFSSRRLCPRR